MFGKSSKNALLRMKVNKHEQMKLEKKYVLCLIPIHPQVF